MLHTLRHDWPVAPVRVCLRVRHGILREWIGNVQPMFHGWMRRLFERHCLCRMQYHQSLGPVELDLRLPRLLLRLAFWVCSLLDFSGWLSELHQCIDLHSVRRHKILATRRLHLFVPDGVLPL